MKRSVRSLRLSPSSGRFPSAPIPHFASRYPLPSVCRPAVRSFSLTQTNNFVATGSKRLFGKQGSEEERLEKQKQEALEARERERQEALAAAEATAVESAEAHEQENLEEADEAEGDAGAYSSYTRERPATSLPLPPSYTLAPTPKQAESLDYVRATSLEDLEEIGELTTWWDQHGHWTAEADDLPTFAPPASSRVRDGKVLDVLIRQALIEVLLWRQAHPTADLSQGWGVLDREWVLKVARAFTIDYSAETGLQLTGPASELLSQIKELEDADKVKPVSRWEAPVTEEEASELVQTWNYKWKSIPLTDDTVRFALRKRIFQLTGRLIPDAKFMAMETMGHITKFLHSPPKAKKLAEELQRTGVLADLPNVKVVDRRITSIDKEVEVGRWKVIEKRLKELDLPVTGHEKYGPSRERQWVQMKP